MIWNDVPCIPPIQVCDKQSIGIFHQEDKFVHTAVQARRDEVPTSDGRKQYIANR